MEFACFLACDSVCPVMALAYLVFGFRFACENRRHDQLAKFLFTPPSGVGSFQNKSHFSTWGLNLCIRE